MTPGDWWGLAACQAAQPDLFIPFSAEGLAENDVARVRAVCPQYWVRAKCLDYALVTRQVPGIWGGRTSAAIRLKRAR
jgi:WhiB family redox-sensing transcriptional regulator